MKKILLTLTALCLTMTAMAQTDRYVQGSYSAPSMGNSAPSTSTNFQKLPPLRTDFDISLSPHSQMNRYSLLSRNSLADQSIMSCHREKERADAISLSATKVHDDG